MSKHSGKVGKVLGLAVMLFGTQQAAAVPSGPLGCAGVFGVGGCAPYGQVTFGTGSPAPYSGSIFEYDETAILDYSVTGATAAVRGVVDLARGQLKVHASGIEDGNPSTGTGGYVAASGTDVFTLHSLSSGPASFSVVLIADGVGSIANNGYSGQVSLQVGVPGGASGSDGGVYQAGGNAPHGATFPLLSTMPGRIGAQLRAESSHSVQLNNPFALAYSLRADVTQGTTFDLLNTAYLSFILPEGVTLSSMGGYSAPAVVPVPAAMWLLASGLLGLIGVARRRSWVGPGETNPDQ